MNRTLMTATRSLPWCCLRRRSRGAGNCCSAICPSSGGPFATFSKTNVIAARDGDGRDQRRRRRQRQEAPHHFLRHRRQAGSGGRRPAQARRRRQGSRDHRPVQLERMPGGVPGGASAPASPTMSMASSAPKLAEPFTYAFRNTTDEGYLFERVLRALKDKNYPTADRRHRLCDRRRDLEDYGRSRAAGPHEEGRDRREAAASLSSPGLRSCRRRLRSSSAQPTDLIGVGSGPEVGDSPGPGIAPPGT